MAPWVPRLILAGAFALAAQETLFAPRHDKGATGVVGLLGYPT